MRAVATTCGGVLVGLLLPEILRSQTGVWVPTTAGLQIQGLGTRRLDLKVGSDRRCTPQPGGSRLIIHAGPRKTGTTSTQVFLADQERWLLKTHGVKYLWDEVVKSGEPRSSLFDLVHAKREQEFEVLARQLRDMLSQPNTTVLISNEMISWLDEASIAHVLSRVLPDNVHVAVSAVIAHRDFQDWMRSEYAQKNGHMTSPKSLLNFLSRQNPELPLEQWDKLARVFHPGCVTGVSYETLIEDSVSMQAFLICNVSAQASGQDWRGCVDAVDNHTSKSDSRRSPPPTAYEVAEAVSNLAASRVASNCSKTASYLTPKSRRVLEVADALPTECGSLSGFRTRQDDEWFARSGARRPATSEHKELCMVNWRRMTDKHWKLLNSLLPPCY